MRIKLSLIALLSVLLLGSCGKKTDLIVYDDSAPEPTLASLSTEAVSHRLHFGINIRGGSGAVFYQIDRAEVDPNCQCINHWRRYYESSPSAQRIGLQQNINIRSSNITYAFRVRVVDSIGRKSAWSSVTKVKAFDE